MSVSKKGKGKVGKPHKGSMAAKLKARKVMELLNETPGMGIGTAMLQVGYAPITAHTPSNLTKSKAWNELLDEMLPQNEVLSAHKGLLIASKLEHMTFPINEPSDEEIINILAEKNCTVRKIVHGEQARHVYFWSGDNRARKDGIDMAYKLRGTYAAEKHLHVGFSLVSLGAERTAQDAQPQLDTQPSMREIE